MNLSIPDYDVKAVIGKGGMAEVYLALHKRLDREVALKVMSSKYADDEAFSERFMREARIAANLIHQNVVQVYDVNRHEGQLFLSMEYVKGGDLSAKINRPQDKQRVIQVVSDLSSALDYAHAQGYIHRDIKPANILFRENGSLALSDFGIARAIHNDVNMTQTGMVVGTPSYMSPEQAQGLELSGSADLYALAVIAYQLVTGELPYQADSSISVAIKHISDPIPTLPAGLASMQPFFDKALAKKPEDRFVNGVEMATAFSEYLGGVSAKLPFNPNSATTLVSEASSNETLAVDQPGGKGELVLADNRATSLQTENTMNTGQVSQHHSNIQLVFMQINKFKVFITEPQKRSILITSLLVLLTLGVGGILAAQLGVFQKTQQLSPGQQARIGQLLQAADANFSEGNLVDPSGNNAYEKYLAILAMSPNDIVALQGITFIGNELEKQFNAALQGKDFEAATALIAKLKEIQPKTDHARLEDKLLAIKQSEAERKAELLGAANSAMQKGNTLEAINLYGNIVENNPESSEAKLTIEKLVAGELNLLESYIGSGDIELAESTLNNAKRAASYLNDTAINKRIALLEPKLQQRETSLKVASTLSSFLGQGDAALASGNLSRPLGASAYYYYREAQKVEPGNRRASEGINSVKAAMENRISSSLDANNVSDAQVTLDRLSEIDSTNPVLATYQSQIKVKQQQLQKQAEIDRRVSTLYERADTYLSSNRARSADKIHAQISRLSPNHEGLNKLGERVADAYVYLAQREIDAQDWADVDVWVSRGLVHVPNHRKLLEMREYAKLKMQQRR